LAIPKRIVKEYIQRKTNFEFPCKPTVENVTKKEKSISEWIQEI
jgi:hypothetical protein